MKKQLPIYSIEKFQNSNNEIDFYANNLAEHVKEHHFTNLPHKHDFYLMMLVTAGSGIHEIDFEKYKVKPGSVFVMKPGQMHYWNLSDDIEGFIFFHSKNFYEEVFVQETINDFQFYNSYQSESVIKLKAITILSLKNLMKEIIVEHNSNAFLKEKKIHSLINLVYLEMAREFVPNKVGATKTYLLTLKKFDSLIEKNFREMKFAKDYASELNISEKHLNRIAKTCLNKTSTQLIAERILLEAKRMLIHSGLSVNQIGDELGFNEKSYFVRFFRKNAGLTPKVFLNIYKKNEFLKIFHCYSSANSFQ